MPMTTMAWAVLAFALAAAGPAGETPKAAEGPAAAVQPEANEQPKPKAPEQPKAAGPSKKVEPPKSSENSKPADRPADASAVPEWLGADGQTVSEESSSPEGVRAWAELLVREGSYSAASRAYEGLVRRWPLTPGAEKDLLSAARSALLARELDRAESLADQLRARWPKGAGVLDREEVRLMVAEARLTPAAGAAASRAEVAAQAKRALGSFTAMLQADRAGPLAQRAALGRGRALLVLGRRTAAIEALESFLKEYPRSDLVPEARRLLAEAREKRARGWSVERSELAGARESVEWAEQGLDAAAREGEPSSEAPASIRETYRAIAARQAELKIEEARLYLRLEQKRAAETVLRSILGRYGDTPSAQAASKLLEELARE